MVGLANFLPSVILQVHAGAVFIVLSYYGCIFKWATPHLLRCGVVISKHFVRFAMYKPCTSLQAYTCPLFVLRVMGAKHILISLAFCACSINPVLSDSPSVEP